MVVLDIIAIYVAVNIGAILVVFLTVMTVDAVKLFLKLF